MARKTKGKSCKAARPLHLLIDTCVWLDLAKDYRQLPLLSALEELVRQGEVILIVPDIVRDSSHATRRGLRRRAGAASPAC
jgi:hypothetical protein